MAAPTVGSQLVLPWYLNVPKVAALARSLGGAAEITHRPITYAAGKHIRSPGNFPAGICLRDWKVVESHCLPSQLAHKEWLEEVRSEPIVF